MKWKKILEERDFGETTRLYTLVINDTETGIILETKSDDGEALGDIYWEPDPTDIVNQNTYICEVPGSKVVDIKNNALEQDFLKSVFAKIDKFVEENNSGYNKLRRAIGRI